MIDITRHIRSYLLSDTGLTDVLGENIYSVTIKQQNPELDTFDTLPQLVIERNISTKQTRDYNQYTITVDLNVLTKTYSQNVDLSILIDNKMKDLVGVDDIRGVELQSINETYISNAFIQKMTYIITN